ncbi:pancreatic trypsin inhibitor-like isoform X3 [Bos javanicus]|uniref:pancreatic trypsin inhibitor-like isoform X3 n=1 Tax=Bos javanicus TaxID=9906 RepID=UPI002AA7D377|nr:pancreatic trypsin inhibitor-like isoform X3 [Bos javanicus]
MICVHRRPTGGVKSEKRCYLCLITPLGQDIKSSIHPQHPQEPSCESTKMKRLCLSAALLFLLVILVDGISEDINKSHDHGYEMTYGRLNEKHSAASKPAFCLKPKSIGPCKGRKIRYFYNAKTRQCQRFFYGGCKGNLNNFYTMALCMNTCGHVEWSWRHGKSHAPKL